MVNPHHLGSSLLAHRYRVLRVLGEGGFGVTYLATDTQMPSQRQCVVKHLKPIQDDAQSYQLVQERFQREAATLERLGEDQDQIPRLYAYFVEGHQFYLVEEWVMGATLTQKLATIPGGLMGEDTVRQVLLDILPVLNYVHQHQIVHRDVKPDNILLRHGDQKPVLIDFGAVKETMGTVVTASGQATSSIVVGTPGFMSAEQIAGQPVYASDVYSLGLTAVYLLTGKNPQVLETDPKTGSYLWRPHAPKVSSSLADVIDRAIQMSPHQRFQTAEEMLDALEGGNPLVNLHSEPTVSLSQVSTRRLTNQGDDLQTVFPMVLDQENTPAPQASATSARRNYAKWIGRGVVGIALIAAGVWAGNLGLRTGLQTSLPKPPTALSPAVPSEWAVMGTATTGESVSVDRQSISRTETYAQFRYRIGNEMIEATADCTKNQWLARGYTQWYAPESEATQAMITYVCQS